ncbi:MucBP domain-containing protein, partial [Leuconostoc citreum]|uniref:MucBP domain-containing protein n=1 Tax=Leuconostoc citreum TaxID=33964 RepID=UPI0032DF4E6B
KPKEISGYKLVETPSNANGTYTDGTTTVNYVYEKEQVTPPATKQGDLVVNYVDKDGNKLATSDNETGDVDSSYTTKPKEISGYKLVETPSNANGTYTDGTTTVNYVYEKEQVSGKTTYGQNKSDKTNREKNLSNENSELPKTSVSDNVSKQYFIVGLLVTIFGFVSIKLRNKNW